MNIYGLEGIWHDNDDYEILDHVIGRAMFEDKSQAERCLDSVEKLDQLFCEVGSTVTDYFVTGEGNHKIASFQEKTTSGQSYDWTIRVKNFDLF